MKNNEVIEILKKWAIEINDPRNDGYVQEGYKKKLREVEAFFFEIALEKAGLVTLPLSNTK